MIAETRGVQRPMLKFLFQIRFEKGCQFLVLGFRGANGSRQHDGQSENAQQDTGRRTSHEATPLRQGAWE
jgi:hypothetical protein